MLTVRLVGKTILASLLVEEARKLQSVTVVFFYCKYHDPQRDSFLAVARSLLWQLLRHDGKLQQDNDLLAFFYENVAASGDESLQSIKLAKDMLTIAVQKLDKVYIILDGLDECPVKEKKLISSWFCDVVDGCYDTEAEAMRCLFISQDDNDCGKLLGRLPTVKVSSSDNNSDILAFCHSWEKQIQLKFCLSEPEVQFIGTEVTKRADGKDTVLGEEDKSNMM